MLGDWIITISGGYYTPDFEIRNRFNDKFEDAIVFKNQEHEEVYAFAKKRLNGIKTSWRVISYGEAFKLYEAQNFVIINDNNYKLGQLVNIKEAIFAIQKGELVCCDYQEVKTLWTKETLPTNINIGIITDGRFRIVSEV